MFQRFEGLKGEDEKKGGNLSLYKNGNREESHKQKKGRKKREDQAVG